MSVRQNPGQLGDFRHIGLLEEDRLLRIQSASQKIQRHIERVLPPLLGIEQRRHRMIIGDEIKRLALLLQLDGRPHHPEIISEMQRARRLDAG